MGYKGKFTSLTPKDGGHVTFGNNAKGKIISIGNIGNGTTIIKDVLLVDGLKHNLLNISQLCDKGYNVIFDHDKYVIKNSYDSSILLVASLFENVCTCSFDDFNSQNLSCLNTLSENSWLWHRRLGHASMELISNLSKKSLICGLPHLKFVKNKVCDACQLGKQARLSFK